MNLVGFAHCVKRTNVFRRPTINLPYLLSYLSKLEYSRVNMLRKKMLQDNYRSSLVHRDKMGQTNIGTNRNKQHQTT